jgi:pseudouridine-5'-monophosphatase
LLGVKAGRAAGMQVVWCPHPGLVREGEGGKEILKAAGREMSAELREVVFSRRRADSLMEWEVEEVKARREWVRMVETLKDFEFGSYGIEVDLKRSGRR